MFVRLGIPFFFMLLWACLWPFFFPSVVFYPFAPFLVMISYTYPSSFGLVLAIGCGWVIDLFSSDGRLGIYALSHATTLLVLFRLRRYFFADQKTTLPFLTACAALCLTLIEALSLTFLEGKPFPLSMKWVFTDLLIMPWIDGAYAWCVWSWSLQALFPKGMRRDSRRRALQMRFRQRT